MNKKDINFVGIGSLGSFTAFLAAKMIGGAVQAEMTVWDFDTTEQHNALNQLYRKNDAGKSKTGAFKNLLKILAPGVILHERSERVSRTSELHGVVVVLVDSIKARQEIFQACVYRADIPLYIEARSGLDGAVVYALDPRDPDGIRRYEQTLLEHEGVQAPCANQNTIPNLWHVAAAIGEILARFYSRKIPRSEFVQIIINTEHLPIIQSKVYTD